MKFPVSAKLVISAKMGVEFIFDLFSMKTMVIGTNYIPYHLNVVSVQLVGFGFHQVQTGAVLDVLSYCLAPFEVLQKTGVRSLF